MSSPTPDPCAPLPLPTPRSVPRPRVLSGMRPTGRLHLGNYMGALYNWVRLQADYECYFFIADLHALTTDYADPSLLKQNIFDIALDFLAAGINPGKCTLFVQSHVPQHAELHLLFSMITPVGWLERVPTYKDQQEQLSEKELNTYGFLGYPLLQSADILLYKPKYVPVGQDQVAHVELTREVARRFNHFYSPKRVLDGTTQTDPERLLLPEPDVLLTPSPKLPGLDGRKMSKSYGNAIFLSDDLATVERKARSMTNGGQRPTQFDPGDPDICPVGDLHRVFSPPEVDETIRRGCRTATIGCDECKFKMGLSVFAAIQPMQAHRRDLEARPHVVWEVLENGAARARQAAEITMNEVREAVGLSKGLSGIRTSSSRSPASGNNPRDLSGNSAWWNLPQAEMESHVRTLWRQQVVSPEAQIKQGDAPGLWLTPRNQRVFVAVARQNDGDVSWTFTVKAKSYEVLILLCWKRDGPLVDFVLPQKIFLAEWVRAKKAGDGKEITFSVAEEEDGVTRLHLPHAEGIAIASQKGAYAAAGL